MKIEALLRSAAVRAGIGTAQREQAEMLLAQFQVAKKYGFVDSDLKNSDSEAEDFKGLAFDKETREALLQKGYLVFQIRAIPYCVMDFDTREQMEYEPVEREVAVPAAEYHIPKSKAFSTYGEHAEAISQYGIKLKQKIWTVDVIMADVATYHQLEQKFDSHFNYRTQLFETKSENRGPQGLEVFTSSKFDKKQVTLGKQGAGWGTKSTFSGLVDLDNFDPTNATAGRYNEKRVFVTIPVVVPATEPLFSSI